MKCFGHSKKHCAAVAIVALLLPLLAACGGSSATTAPTAGASTAKPTAASANATTAPSGSATTGTAAAIPRLDKPVTIEMFTNEGRTEVGPPAPDYFWVKAVKDALNVDVKLTFITEGSQYYPKLQARAAANDLPDLFTIDLARESQLVNQGLLADWAPFLASMPGYVKDHNVEDLKSVGTLDGKLYSLATQSNFPYKTSVYIRKDWLDKLGLQVPKTLDEYLNVMKAFTTQDPDGNGKADTYGFSTGVNSDGKITNLDPILGAFGALDSGGGTPFWGGWRVENNTLVPVATSPEMRDALQFFNKMVQAGVMDPDWKAQKPEDLRNKWKAGKIGIFSEDWCATLCPQNYMAFAQANPKGVLQIIDPPVGPGGKSAAGTISQVGPMYAISKKAADASKGEAIARLMEWMNGPGYYLTTYGEEGKDKGWYRDASGNLIQNLTPSYLPNVQLSNWSAKGTPEEWGVRYAGTTKQGDGSTLDIPKDVLQRALNLPKVDITQFASLPPAPAETAADLTRTINQGAFQFATGQKPFSEWDTYVKSVKTTGQDEWMKLAEKRAREIGLIK